MKKVKIYYVKVFNTDKRYGNLAGVVLDAQGLTGAQMKNIARFVGASETAFVFPSKRKDFKIRWFTPTTEVGICIHATIAALAALKRLGKISRNQVLLETKNTLLKAKLVKDKIFIQIGGYKLLRQEINIKVIKKYLDLKFQNLVRKPQIVQIFQDKELLIPVRNLAVLKQLKPNFKRYANLCKRLKITGISIFTKQTFNPNNNIHTREFAPLYGYLEDPLCGMAAGAITTYLRKVDNRKGNLRVEQGNFLKSPGVIEVLLSGKNLLIGGNYKVFKTQTKLLS